MRHFITLPWVVVLCSAAHMAGQRRNVIDCGSYVVRFSSSASLSAIAVALITVPSASAQAQAVSNPATVAQAQAADGAASSDAAGEQVYDDDTIVVFGARAYGEVEAVQQIGRASCRERV